MKRQVKDLLDLMWDRQPDDGDTTEEIMGVTMKAGCETALNSRHIERQHTKQENTMPCLKET